MGPVSGLFRAPQGVRRQYVAEASAAIRRRRSRGPTRCRGVAAQPAAVVQSVAIRCCASASGIDPGADPPVQLVLDLVLRVRRRARLRPEVPLVAGSAAELQRDQMVFLVTPWAGVGVAVGGDLLAL